MTCVHASCQQFPQAGLFSAACGVQRTSTSGADLSKPTKDSRGTCVKPAAGTWSLHGSRAPGGGRPPAGSLPPPGTCGTDGSHLTVSLPSTCDPSDETYARGLAHRAECETQGKGNSRRAPSHCGCRAWAAWKRAVHQSRRAGYQRHSTKTDRRFLHYSRRETKLSAKGRAGV